MKGNNHWSYHPYKPFGFNTGDIYICRVVPHETSIHFEWLKDDFTEFEIYYRLRGAENFMFSGKTSGTEYDIENLEIDTEYEFYVKSGEKKSRVRLAYCGGCVGTVVNYLHPEDEAYVFSGKYLCSPSLVRHPDGYLLASMDLFAGGHPQNLTLIFRSDDNGETWHYVSELMPCFWGKMFIHKGELYMLSCSTEYGDLLIGKSSDGGKTFTQPVALLRGSTGKAAQDGVHKNPQNVIYYKGRIYETFEWGTYSKKGNPFTVHVMSCDENDDLLNADNWSFTEPLEYNPEWKGVVEGPAKGNIEGTLCVAPDGNLYSIMRYMILDGAIPPYGLVLAFKVNTDNPEAPLEYSHSVEMPCNNSKFMIKKDEVTNTYYSIVTRIDCIERMHRRNLLSLMKSNDLKNWTLVCDLIDCRDKDPMHYGFQYVDFEIEGDDIIYLCRTGYNNSNDFHNTNYSTFHHIKNFRNL